MAVRALCLCDGYGGFELGLREHGVRTVARVERDSHAASVLVARMEEQRLDPAPVWDDLETFDGAAWRGCVDLVTAGFPCQPFSAAGQRKGVDDDRWLWPAIGRIIRDVGPRAVFLENVPGLVQHGLPHVLADLADLGFDAEWGLLSAADVGAPHKRQRFWLLAVAHHHHDGFGGLGRQPEHDRVARNDVDRPSGTDVGDPDDHRDGGERDALGIEVGRTEVAGSGQDVAHDITGGCGCGHWFGASYGHQITCPLFVLPERRHLQDVADTNEPRHQGRGPAEPSGRDVARERCVWPPKPDDTDGWERWIAAGGPEPSLRRSTDGRPVGLADALHLGGNGLVPLAAAHAFVQLATRLGIARG